MSGARSVHTFLLALSAGLAIRDASAAETASWQHILPSPPEAPASPGPSDFQVGAMATLGDKVVLFHGIGDEQGMCPTWEWDGARWTRRAPPASPSHRVSFAMATLGSKIVLFGGQSDWPELLGETWEWDGNTWTKRTPPASPPGRFRHAMATLGGKVVLFGGQDNDGPLDDLWEWDGNTWTERTPASRPPGAWGPSMVTLGDRIVLGASGGIWSWDGTSWTHVTTSVGPDGPLVARGDQLISVGLSGTWILDGAVWRKIVTSAGPHDREYPLLAALGGKVVLFGGGWDGANTGTVADTWTFDGSTWTEVTPTPTIPGRWGHAMATLGGRVVLFGGYGDNGPLRDSWTWDGVSWAKAASATLPARYSHAMATLAGSLVRFGGWADEAIVGGDTWEWNGAAWTLATPAASPSGRIGHAMATLGDEVVLFGGANYELGGFSQLGDTWEWQDHTWKKPALPVSPPARAGHGMATLRDKVVLFGGSSDAGAFYDTWTYDGRTWTEARPATHPGPEGVAGPNTYAMATLGDRVVLFGGGWNEGFGETWSWDGTAWTRLTAAISPPAREGYAMATLGDTAVLFGGGDDTWLLRVSPATSDGGTVLPPVDGGGDAVAPPPDAVAHSDATTVDGVTDVPSGTRLSPRNGCDGCLCEIGDGHGGSSPRGGVLAAIGGWALLSARRRRQIKSALAAVPSRTRASNRRTT